jgi:hypothetical protein
MVQTGTIIPTRSRCHAGHSIPEGLRRVHCRLWRGRRDDRQGPHRGWRRRRDARRRSDVGLRQRLGDVRLELRFAGPRVRRGQEAVRHLRRLSGRLGHRGRTVHSGAGRLALVSRPDVGWPHASLGPHLAALRTGRLPPQDCRWPRRRLADHLRRHQAVLRQARFVRWHLRHQPRGPDRPAQRARRHFSTASKTASA